METEQQQQPGKGDEQQQQPGTDTPEYWQKRARQWEDTAKKNANDLADLKKQIEDQGKSDSERLTAAVTQAQAEAQQARAEALRYKVGVKHNLPPAWITRLQGSTEEELEADATELAQTLPPAAPSNPPKAPKPLASLQPGGSTPTDEEPLDANETFRQALLGKNN